MIKENQRLLNRFHVLTDGVSVLLTLLLAYWLRFYVLPGGIISVPLVNYVYLGILLAAALMFTYAAMGLYESLRRMRLVKELSYVVAANALVLVGLLTIFFASRRMDYSRIVLALFFTLNLCVQCGKRVFLRLVLRHYRQLGYNQKHVLLVGGGEMAQRYLTTIRKENEYGYQAIGYVAERTGLPGLKYLGTLGALVQVLERHRPDEVVAAIPAEDYRATPDIIAACEKLGVKLSIIPFYAEYMPSNPQFDDLDGIPLLNIRRIPLDNWANAVLKRGVDIVGALVLLVALSPVMLAAAAGVRLSSPGPVFFSQKRVGKNKKEFKMYKFRSMRVNAQETTGWSRDRDDRKTRFGALIRKFSVDELPQLFNVLKGDMSLVGPRPEVPFFVEQFKEEVPLYMVKHQVRPGITGWAQVNGLRGDTSIMARIEHDIYYIEHWSFFFDVEILFRTLFRGVVNGEKLDG